MGDVVDGVPMVPAESEVMMPGGAITLTLDLRCSRKPWCLGGCRTVRRPTCVIGKADMTANEPLCRLMTQSGLSGSA